MGYRIKAGVVFAAALLDRNVTFTTKSHHKRDNDNDNDTIKEVHPTIVSGLALQA